MTSRDKQWENRIAALGGNHFGEEEGEGDGGLSMEVGGEEMGPPSVVCMREEAVFCMHSCN